MEGRTALRKECPVWTLYPQYKHGHISLSVCDRCMHRVQILTHLVLHPDGILKGVYDTLHEFPQVCL